MPITTYPSLVFGTRYPAIPHLAGSAFTDGDVVLSEKQTLAVLARPFVAVEKLDGLNVGFSFVRGVPRIHSRIHGVLTLDRIGPGLWPMVDFVFENLGALWQLLGDEHVLFGEWLEDAPSRLPYPTRDVPFVAFDLAHRDQRTFLPPTRAHALIEKAGLAVPKPLFRGTAARVEDLWPLTRRSRFGGPSEGLVVMQEGRCFKLVRGDFLERELRTPKPRPRPPLPGRVPVTSRVSKRFTRAEEARLEVEVDRLRHVGALGPRLLERRDRTIVMSRLPGRALGPRDDVAPVGRALSSLHRVETSLSLDTLEDRPSRHLNRALRALGPRHPWTRAVTRSLLPLIRSLERGLTAEPVICHGDIKPEHVRVHHGAARFLDFECALVADAAWELGAAFERLDLEARQRVDLTRAYESEDGTRFLRAWLNRLAWQVVQPALLQQTRLSGSGRRIVRRSEARAKRLLEQLTGTRLPKLSA